jgi:hypothetical protein
MIAYYIAMFETVLARLITNERRDPTNNKPSNHLDKLIGGAGRWGGKQLASGLASLAQGPKSLRATPAASCPNLFTFYDR